MARTAGYIWTAEDEARWQRFTKGVPNYGTDERNASRLGPTRASDVVQMLKDSAWAAAPWAVTAAFVASIVLH